MLLTIIDYLDNVMLVEYIIAEKYLLINISLISFNTLVILIFWHFVT